VATQHRAFLPAGGKALFLARAAAALGCAVALLLPVSVQAHEFWLAPDRFQLEDGATARLALRVGENFEGEPVAFARPLIAGFRHYARGASHDLAASVPATVEPVFPFAVRGAGTHLVAIDTHPSTNTLDATKFNDYLDEDGLWRVQQTRELLETTLAPGRERFRRNIKTLFQVGGAGDATWSQRTGQRLEIVPLDDPFRPRTEPVAFRVLFDGQPLSQALLKFWHGAAEERLVQQAWTDADGQAAGTLQPGTWMVSVVHMVPAAGGTDIDWESYWGNLTFAVPQAGSAAPRR
jgi:uncharacterized GH25 family protein